MGRVGVSEQNVRECVQGQTGKEVRQVVVGGKFLKMKKKKLPIEDSNP